MPFDPDAYLAGGAVVAPAPAPAAPAAFDPDAYIKSPAFDPTNYVSSTSSPEERMQALAPLVAKPDSSPADESAYKSAYTDYYNQNDTLSRAGQTLKDIAGSGSKIGGALWGMMKGAGQTISNLPVPGYGLGSDLVPAAQGVASGARATYMLGQSLSEKAMEQINNVAADVAPLPEAREEAAKLAVDRLKLNARSAGLNANPYDPQTQARQAALFDTGSAGGAMLVPGVGEASALAGKTAQAAGDIIESGAYKMVGAGLKVAPPIIKTAEAAGTAYAAGKALINSPLSTLGTAAASVLTDKASSIFSKGASFQSGLFQASDKLADVMLSTPLGDNALDSVVKYAPVAIDQAKQDLSLVRANTQQLLSDLSDAKAAGESTKDLEKAISKSAKQEAAGNFKVNIMEKGASMAQSLQKLGVAGMPSKLADATAGALQGGLLGGVIAASNAQPGDDSTIANGASKGAAYGGILSMLGTASQASQSSPGPSSFQQRAAAAQQQIQQAQGATYAAPIGPPPASSAWAQLQAANARLQAGKTGAGFANIRPKVIAGPTAPSAPVIVSGTPGGGVTGFPISPLRQIANEKATNIFTDASGVPHDTNELADAIKQTAGGFVESAKKEIPGQTYTLNISPPREVDKKLAMPAGGQASDQDLQALAAIHKPVSSSAFESVGYNPDKQLLGVHMQKKDGYQKYVFHEVSPEDYNNFLTGNGFNGSMGKYFNQVLRNEWPYYHVMDPRYAPAPVPPVSGAAAP